MKQLDALAKELFTKFSLRETGKEADWNYLSDERKIAWMEDVLRIANHVLNDLQKDFKPLPTKNHGGTVYEMGFRDGVREERALTTQMVEKVQQKLVDRYEDFLYDLNKKN